MSTEIIDAPELAKRWQVPESWIRGKVRSRTRKEDQIAHIRLGKYVRFEWGSAALEAWLAKHRQGGTK